MGERTLEGDLIEAIAKVEDGLWIQFDCCRKRRVVIDAILPVIGAWLGQVKAPRESQPRRASAAKRGKA